MNKFYVQLTAGMFVIVGALCLAWLSVRLGGLEEWGEGYPVVAKSTDIGGLQEGADVSIAGVKIGRVDSVDLEADVATLTLRIDPKVNLPEGTTGTIRTRGLIGEQYVSLEPGSGDGTIESGGEIGFIEPAFNLQSAVAGMGFTSAGGDIEDGYTVQARFSDVGGLRKGAAVSIAGVTVGSVGSVELDNYAALVTLRIMSDVKLPGGTIASVRTNGLIGQHYIYLSPGGGMESIEPGGRIQETQPAVDLYKLISKYAFGDVESDL